MNHIKLLILLVLFFSVFVVSCRPCQSEEISIDCAGISDPAAGDNTTCLMSVGDTLFLLECADNKLPAEIKKSTDQRIDILSVDFSNCSIVAKEKVRSYSEDSDVPSAPIHPLVPPIPPELFDYLFPLIPPGESDSAPEQEKERFEVAI